MALKEDIVPNNETEVQNSTTNNQTTNDQQTNPNNPQTNPNNQPAGAGRKKRQVGDTLSCLEWKQTSNPLTSTLVTGFELEGNSTFQNFSGLIKAENSKVTVMNEVATGYYWVGVDILSNETYQGPSEYEELNMTSNSVELWVQRLQSGNKKIKEK